ncbi:hypothetical protein ACGFIF_42970 [Kribbella sp. NPDC049174]|uniref:hypothetical protein n=1 Tax=Kribbella sp. NPDC049174 TaxID=3364112 RepID=UPI003721511A
MSDHDRIMRELAEENVVHAAEEAAAGIQRLVVLHDLQPDQRDELAELTTFVEDVCARNGIEYVGGVGTSLRPAEWQGPSRTTWRFGPPTSAADLAIVRVSVEERYPAWPIEADDY